MGTSIFRQNIYCVKLLFSDCQKSVQLNQLFSFNIFRDSLARVVHVCPFPSKRIELIAIFLEIFRFWKQISIFCRFERVYLFI